MDERTRNGLVLSASLLQFQVQVGCFFHEEYGLNQKKICIGNHNTLLYTRGRFKRVKSIELYLS